MTPRDADPRFPAPAPPGGHARLLDSPLAGWDRPARVALWVVGVLLAPLALPVIGGWPVFRGTRRGPLGRMGSGLLARLCWVGAWGACLGLALWPERAALFTAASMLGWTGFVASFHTPRLRLTRPGSPAHRRQRAIRAALWLGLLAAALLSGQVGLGPDRAGPVLAAPWALFGLLAAWANWAGLLWTEAEERFEAALARTRLLGVGATWHPAGYAWRGVEAGQPWRVWAGLARVPPALRFEVAVDGAAGVRITRYRPDPAGGDGPARTVPGAVLRVDGVAPERAEALLASAHDGLLALVHGQGARLEGGLLRLDRDPEPPLDRPGPWMEATLRELLRVAAQVEEHLAEPSVGTDEVVRELMRWAEEA